MDQWDWEYYGESAYYYDICDGENYWMTGTWSTFFPFVAAIIAWCGSCKRIPETFSVLYRIQATFVSFARRYFFRVLRQQSAL